MRKITLHIAALLAAVTLVASPVAVLAHNGVDHSNGDTSHGENGDRSGNDDKNEDGTQQNRGARLDAAKLRVCQNREKNIKGIMTRSVDRVTKQVTLFDKIAERTKAFYVDKGNVLTNYDELVAAADAAKAEATASLDDVKDSTTFTCSGEDPKGAAGTFKTEMKELIADLKAYRTAVKNLIVGVKSVQGDQ
jgi:hypothetical protein